MKYDAGYKRLKIIKPDKTETTVLMDLPLLDYAERELGSWRNLRQVITHIVALKQNDLVPYSSFLNFKLNCLINDRANGVAEQRLLGIMQLIRRKSLNFKEARIEQSTPDYLR